MAKLKKISVPVPQTRTEFEALAVELAEIARAGEKLAADTAEKITRVKLDLKQALLDLTPRHQALWAAVSAYAEAHRAELLPADRKSVGIAAGTIGWRKSPPAIVIDGDEDETILRLAAMGLERFLREKIEIDKAALLAEPEAVAAIGGIAITQSEELYFKPLDLSGELTLKARKRATTVEAA